MKPLPPLPLIDGALFIDNSGWVENLATCNRLLQYKSLNLRIPTGEKAALNFGSAIHLGLEYRYLHYGNGPIDDAYYDVVGRILTQHYEQHPAPVDDWRNLNWTMELLRHYNDRYPTEPFSLFQYDKPAPCPYCDGTAPCLWCNGTRARSTMVELPFALPLYVHKIKNENEPYIKDQKGNVFVEVPIYFSGKIDLPALNDDGIFIHDNKTSSALGDQFADHMKVSDQQKGYAWAFQKLTGKHVTGFCVNGIRSKEAPQYVLQGKSYTRNGKTSTAASWWEESFVRVQNYLTPDELAEWEHNTIALMERFFWEYSRGYLSMSREQCTHFGRCPYYDVCATYPVEERDNALAMELYTDNTWTPLNRIKPVTK